MTFPTKPAATFALPVDVPQPGAQPVKLPLVVEHLGRREMKHWCESAKAHAEDVDWLMVVVKGWGPEVVSPDGNPVEFTRAAFDAVLNDYPAAAMAIFEAYLKEHNGARVKNSEGL